MRLMYCLLLFVSFSANAEGVLQDYLRDLKSLHAEFSQQLYDERGNILETATGTLDLQRPGRFRWQYQQPYQQLIIADGKTIWIYDQDLEQVTVKDFAMENQNTPALLLSSQRPVEELFSIQPLVENAAGETRLQLLPKSSEEAQFESMELTFQAGELSSLRLQDKLGQTTLMTFNTQQRNPNLAAELFQFDTPPGVDLIDGRK